MQRIACALCLTPGPLRESHIIPNAYFRAMKRQRSGQLITFNTIPGEPASLSNESWSEPMLCECCERRFSKLETKCIRSLRVTAIDIQQRCKDGTSLHQYNFATFSRFLASIFWRAAVSYQKAFAAVAIPSSLAESIRLNLLNGVIPVHPYISCQISKIVDGSGRIATTQFEHLALSPQVKLLNGTARYTFIFAGYVVRYYVPSCPQRYRRQLGFVRSQTNLFIPAVFMKSIPELMCALSSGYAKAALAQTTFEA